VNMALYFSLKSDFFKKNVWFNITCVTNELLPIELLINIRPCLDLWN